MVNFVASGKRDADTRAGPVELLAWWVMYTLETKRHTNGTGSVKALRKGPLTLIHLTRPTGDVIRSRIPEHIVHRILLADVLRIAPDHNHHLRLVVARIIHLRDLRENRRRRPRIGKRSRGFQK